MQPIWAQWCTWGNEWLESTESQPEMDHGWNLIVARDGSWPERDSGRRCNWRERSCVEMDRGRIWIATQYGWTTGVGWHQMDQGRRMTIDLVVYMKLRSHNQAQICRHTVFWRHGSTKSKAENYSDHYSDNFSEIPNHAPTCPSSNGKYDPKSDPESHRYNGDTTHALRDLSLAVQRSVKRGITVPESQQPLPQTLTVLEVQEWSTENCI